MRLGQVHELPAGFKIRKIIIIVEDLDRVVFCQARQEIERVAMEAVIAAERALGREPRDVSAAKVGYDIESRDPKTDCSMYNKVYSLYAGSSNLYNLKIGR